MPRSRLLGSILRSRSVVRAPTGVAVVLAACAAPGCARRTEQPSGSPVIATVGDSTITVNDMQDRINGQSPFARARFAAPEKKKELLDEMVRFEVLAGEAKRRGYDQDPAVVRAMKQQMVSKLLERDFESKNTVADVSDAEIEAYYQGHPEEFHKKSEVRIAEIVVADQAKAQRAYAEAKALPANPGGDPRGFRDLVSKYSEDDPTKRRDERLFFAEDSTAYPKAVVDATFRLRDVGEIAPPVAVDGGWAIVELAQRKPAFDRSLADARPEIQQRLLRDVRSRALDAYVADLARKTKTEEHDELLDRVVVQSVAAGGAARPPGAEAPRPEAPR